MVPRLFSARRLLKDWLTPDRIVVQRQYFEKLGRPLNLGNPQGFHEKVCWLRLNRLTPLHSYCADKITAAAYVASRIGAGHTATRYFTTRDPAQLSAKAIPARRCVIKGNHESQHVIIVEDTQTADWPDIRAQMGLSLSRNFYRLMRERQYKSIRPAIIVEEMVENGIGSGAGDFNIYCIAGKPRFCVQFAEGSIPLSRPGTILAPDGTPLNVSRHLRPFLAEPMAPPAHLRRMVEMAEHLAAPFEMVRVDFLTAGDDVYVNELTFSPFAGYNRFTPESFELEMGALIDLNAPQADWRPYLAAARSREPEVLPLRR